MGQRARIQKRIIPIVVLGEKDHGKSTLLGRLLYETGSIPRDRIRDVRGIARRLGKKFEWAHLLDSFRYEREHDMTLDTTRAVVELHDRLYEFIDVPGHEELIRNMVTGASDAHYAVLVVAVDKGVEPQTLRHVYVARMLGIEKIIVALNKCDALDYSKERIAAVAKDVRVHMRHSGFRNPLIIPIVAHRGENVLKSSQRMRWFKGPTFARALRNHFPPRTERAYASSLVVPVQDVYPSSTVVGRVESGRITAGQSVYLVPSQSRHRVRELFSGGKKLKVAVAHAAVEVVLEPFPTHVRRGDLIVEKLAHASRRAQCRCFLFKTLDAKDDLSVEIFFKRVRVRSVKGQVKALVPVTLTLSLSDAVTAPAKFVIREKGTIAGFGSILALL